MSIKRIAAAITVFVGAALAALSWAGEFDDLDDEIRLIRAVDVSLAEAIEKAETHTSGRAFEAELDDDSFTATFEVEVVVDRRVVDVRIDANSGEILSVRRDDDDVPEPRATPLAQIVRTAEQSVGGQAYEVSCDDDRFNDHCEVELVTAANQIYEVVVAGNRGNIIRTRLEQDD